MTKRQRDGIEKMRANSHFSFSAETPSPEPGASPAASSSPEAGSVPSDAAERLAGTVICGSLEIEVDLSPQSAVQHPRSNARGDRGRDAK